jgi:hypothetical protein
MEAGVCFINTYGVTEAAVYQTAARLNEIVPRSAWRADAAATAGFPFSGVHLALAMPTGDESVQVSS